MEFTDLDSFKISKSKKDSTKWEKDSNNNYKLDTN